MAVVGCRGRLIETFEDLVELVGRNLFAIVADCDDSLIVVMGKTDIDLSASRGILEGVGEDIHQNLVEIGAIEPDGESLCIVVESKADAFRLRLTLKERVDLLDECHKIRLTHTHLHLSLVDEAGISRVHLHRKMKELTGQTPHDFIRNIRLKKAANLLANQGMNVTEVMYACGFANSASFSTVFKKFYGMSPRDYMKEHEEREE